MSEVRIKGGTGKGYIAKVDISNRLHVKAVTETEALQASEDGLSFNINTGLIALTAETESAVAYVKNNDTKDLILTDIAVGVGDLGGTIDDPLEVEIVRNPTGGTIVSNATTMDIAGVNRNFGSARSIVADMYKGAEGYTLTGGTDVFIFFTNENSRLFAGIDVVVPPGTSIGVNVRPNATSGGNLYVAFVAYLVEKDD